MTPAAIGAIGWLCLALALLPLGAIVGMCVAERYREDRDVWRTPWTWVATGRCETVAETDVDTEFGELPSPIQRLSRWSSQQAVLLDPLPEHVDGYAIGGRHGVDATAVVSDYQPRHSLLADITEEFVAIVAGAWSAQERESLALEWWCASCRGDLEHGRAHEACDACACPCALVEVS